MADSRVVESRDVGEGLAVRRRRECLACNKRYTTYERIERPSISIVKRDGQKQLYDRGKLIAGISRATGKSAVRAEQLEDVVANIEERIYASGETEVESTSLGEMVMDELAERDEVAYVRFASVYRQFQSISSFEQELKAMKAKKKRK